MIFVETQKNNKRKAKQPPIAVYICIFILISLYGAIGFAAFIAPYDPLSQNPTAGYAQPSHIYWDKQGPYIYPQKYKLNEMSFKKESLEIRDQGKYHLKFFKNNKLVSVDQPAYFYILGTDRIGRDLFSRLIYGGRPSLTIGFIGLLIAFPIGIIYGGISGFFGGWIDNLMMRLAEAIMSFPSFYLLIILSAILPASLSNFQRFAMITLILSFISWASLARIIRGQILSLKEKEFIEAARSIGQNYLVIITKHLIPHTASFLIIAITLSIPSFIIGESALSFLGLGINQPDPSWGNILAEGKDLSNILTRPWLIWSPSLLIFGAVFSFNILGDYLRDRLDPKLSQ
ncbi:MAG: ABC transporter permease [Candidatus Melainabacteria bacterium]|jgi:peptide/nickel transport system permease protein|nr:ABC transporter permease [Candidatus Melainabacteria bacterium]